MFSGVAGAAHRMQMQSPVVRVLTDSQSHPSGGRSAAAPREGSTGRVPAQAGERRHRGTRSLSTWARQDGQAQVPLAAQASPERTRTSRSGSGWAGDTRLHLRSSGDQGLAGSWPRAEVPDRPSQGNRSLLVHPGYGTALAPDCSDTLLQPCPTSLQTTEL